MIELSVVCPILNEEEHIAGLIDFFNRAMPVEKELILIDGGSNDGTLTIVKSLLEKYNNVRLLVNPDKYVPFALNLAIPECRGRYIVRIDGHSTYEDNYFQSILNAFAHVDADIVGGPTRTRFRGAKQEAIAYAVTHPAGIGGSKVHDETFEGYTDSVTFGAWKREIFEKTGLFDTRLVRNQDDEFHYRARSKGFKIYQDPTIRLYYSPRSTFKGLFKQYFQYGLYKPLVLKKIKSAIAIRHLIPSGFVFYLLVLPLPPYFWMKLIPLLMYIGLVITVGMISKKKLSVKLMIIWALICVHASYGLGFLLGLFKRP